MEEQAVEIEETRDQAGEVRRASRARLWWGIAAILTAALIVVGVWVWTSGTWKGWRAVARVNGKRITLAQLDRHLLLLVRLGQIRPEVLSDPARKKDVERAALDDLVSRRLMLAEAERLNIIVGTGEEDVIFGKAHGGQPGEPKLVEAAKKAGENAEQMRQEVRRQLLMTRLTEKVTESVTVDDEDVAKYYEVHRQTFSTPGTAHLRLLIVESRKEAERLRSQAMKGADFGTLVRDYSKGGNKESGGDLGWVDPLMLPPAIATAVAAIPKAGVTPVIEAKGRFYVVRVEGRKDPRQLSLAEVQEGIKQMLLAERKRAKFAEWLNERRRSAHIEIYL